MKNPYYCGTDFFLIYYTFNEFSVRFDIKITFYYGFTMILQNKSTDSTMFLCNILGEMCALGTPK